MYLLLLSSTFKTLDRHKLTQNNLDHVIERHNLAMFLHSDTYGFNRSFLSLCKKGK